MVQPFVRFRWMRFMVGSDGIALLSGESETVAGRVRMDGSPDDLSQRRRLVRDRLLRPLIHDDATAFWCVAHDADAHWNIPSGGSSAPQLPQPASPDESETKLPQAQTVAVRGSGSS
jgi:hypothetical protein